MPECAILSSIDNYDGKSTEESHITTPEVLELYQHFENAYESGISHLVMEASSQALKYGRVRGIKMCIRDRFRLALASPPVLNTLSLLVTITRRTVLQKVRHHTLTCFDCL